MDNITNLDCVDTDNMSKQQIKELVEYAIQNNYILNENSLECFKYNKKIIINTINNKYENSKYIPDSMLIDKDIFNLLISKGYKYNTNLLRELKLDTFKNSDTVLETLKYDYLFAKIDNPVYQRIIANIYYDSIKYTPTIKSMTPYIEYISELKWLEYKKAHINDVSNVFVIIINHLRNCQNINEIYNLNLLTKMKNFLNKKYDMLIDTMEQYFIIYHNNTNNKQDLLKPYIDTISNLSSLYIATYKENYKSKVKEVFNEWLKKYFVLKKSLPIVNHRIIEHRQMNKMKELFINNDPEINLFVNDLVLKYNNQYDNDLIYKFIKEIIINHQSSINEFMNVPDKLYEYERCKYAKKVTYRLNRGFISIDDPSAQKYMDIITYKDGLYNYSGIEFDINTINNIEHYHQLEYLYKQIRKDILLKTKQIQVSKSISKKISMALENEFPLTDEYFKFDPNIIKKIKFKSICDYCFIDNNTVDYLNKNIQVNNYFTFLYNLFVNKRYIWFMLMQLYEKNDYILFEDNQLNIHYLENSIDQIPIIIQRSKNLNWELNNISDFILCFDMVNNCDEKTSAILGNKVVSGLYQDCRNEPYAEETLSMARDLIVQMSYRDRSTVPFINGKYLEYNYHMYDYQDESVLLSGINTNACFSINDTDHDFLHYCTLNKNGFVIKITDQKNNMIARASGFRHGNCVFINQLRTIYDKAGHYRCEDEIIRNNIIETFKKGCNDIINISHNNQKELDKIDYVIVTQSYCLSNYPSNVDNETTEYIGENPIDNNSADWDNFVKNTLNLIWINNLSQSIITDYGNYDLICLASYKNQKVSISNIKFKDVKALYERPRNPIITGYKNDAEIIQKANKIYGICSYNEGIKFKPIVVPPDALITVGDNWVIIYKDNSIIDSCLLEYDYKAVLEYQEMVKSIHNNKQLKKKLSNL